MDDLLEQPNKLPNFPLSTEDARDEDQSSDEEDGGLDWTKLPSASVNIARPVIPKRGEKDYEPKAGGGSGLQLHVLDRARTAMFNTLRATRGVNNKSMSYAIWYPQLARAHVTVAKGIHFSSMGHSVQRPIADADVKLQKRLELLPEEALYLLERGALWCWQDTNEGSWPINMSDIDARGPPMSVQQAYACMIGKEDLTLEEYQVFAYLKRLGYVVTRAEAPSLSYPVHPPLTKVKFQKSFSQTFFTLWSAVVRKFFRLFSGINWWKPFRIHHYTNYSSLFESLRFVPSGHTTPLQVRTTRNLDSSSPRSPYHIFYHLYKPSTPFRKTAPPNPDFYVVVVNARSSLMPSLRELAALYDKLPETPSPLPRQRQAPTTSQNAPAAPSALAEQHPISIFQRISRLIFPPKAPSIPLPPSRKPHPFAALKAGKKMVVIAAVDSGNISFFRFGQGAFDEWPMI
ncbi:hypothetical protein NEOLEDRAFT_1087445 [Neolentinus lepideus HHB14362 ss-1]|uniref:tRNA-splicing endonuclease subunit Sen54 N-terminal domain-containing protein n=1 Tax=Neolentinus lepideus HHB14362 ss-1 TaxID=1314782 RepID=A0A165UM72_9AGAM|nr:hypothetical protein NEOLEDRAFT_1087445 [Neolentinus lepideus HHB14362 ss-1]